MQEREGAGEIFVDHVLWHEVRFLSSARDQHFKARHFKEETFPNITNQLNEYHLKAVYILFGM